MCALADSATIAYETFGIPSGARECRKQWTENMYNGRQKTAAIFAHRQKELNRAHIFISPFFSPFPAHSFHTHRYWTSSCTPSSRSSPYSSSEVVPRRPMVDGDARQWRLPGLWPWQRESHCASRSRESTIGAKARSWDQMLR